jgi:hypothetical protein
MAYPNIEAILVALLRRLDRSIAKAWEQEITIDEVNG